eukprot:2933_1
MMNPSSSVKVNQKSANNTVQTLLHHLSHHQKLNPTVTFQLKSIQKILFLLIVFVSIGFILTEPIYHINEILGSPSSMQQTISFPNPLIKQKKYGYAIFVDGQRDYLRSIFAFKHALKKYKCKYPLIIFALYPGVNPKQFTFFEENNIPYIIIDKNTLNNISGCAGCNQKQISKLMIWNATQYDKLLYMDCDVVILGNLDFVFDQFPTPTFSIDSWPIEFNTGILLFAPNQTFFEQIILQYLPKMHKFPRNLAFNEYNRSISNDNWNTVSNDQGFLFSLFTFFDIQYYQFPLSMIIQTDFIHPKPYKIHVYHPMWDVKTNDPDDHGNYYRAKYFWNYRAQKSIKIIHFTNHKIWHIHEIEKFKNLTDLMLENMSYLNDYHEQILLETTVIYYYFAYKGQIEMKPKFSMPPIPNYCNLFINQLKNMSIFISPQHIPLNASLP